MKNIIFEKCENLEKFVSEWGFEKFRVKQINNWIFKHFTPSFDEMSNIPSKLIEILKKNYYITSGKIIKINCDNNDRTKKILIEFEGGDSVENAIIATSDRITFCLSTQSGCPIGCVFCASGKLGFKRNLTREEIIDEFIFCSKETRKPDNIVIMGVGEPLLNLSNLLEALHIITSPDFFSISPRRITISTSGNVPGILKLSEEKKQWNLAISLHTTNDTIRKKIIPNCQYKIKDIISAVNLYKKSTGRIVTIEYVLIDGLNDTEKDAIELAAIAKTNNMKINLIPFNPHHLSNYKRPNTDKIKAFENTLKKCNVPFTIRLEKGGNINAACGQLMALNSKKMEKNYAG
ncbi:MAG TPA: 23S rRNA (adenine(2503)-C(2))-methyltransferase RlmN, partial [Victivallales bacterium]|nr:23S rRNA (adenine(2503)-C(2))-methyltransferase RlmN [Victivallales bacterium]